MSDNDSKQNGHSRQEKSKTYTIRFTKAQWKLFWEWMLLAYSLCRTVIDENTRSPRSQRFHRLNMKSKAKRWLKIASRLDREVFSRVKEEINKPN